MEADRIKWNRRFESEDSFLGLRPSPFLSREIDRIKLLVPGHAALDIACGEGRNSLFLAQNGFQVTALDISDVGLSKGVARAKSAGVSIDFRRVNLDGYRISEKYDLILNFNFLMRGLIPSEVQALAPGGLLLFDTILESPQLLASHDPSYLLRKGELTKIFGAYQGEILFSEESDEGDMPTARVLFRKSHETI
ncbi:MAG: methyltransferase domain-containing protein [Desulfuromonadaceae bacterium]|nr:methyltransferase domain-containing protein [Desulfuromonadaceae bacterium]